MKKVDEVQVTLKPDKEQHIENMNTHLKTLQAEMQSIQVRFLTTPKMPASTIIGLNQRFAELNSAAMFTLGMLNGAYPETKSGILVPKKEGNLITKLFN